MTKVEFWMQVYIAAIRSGRSELHARSIADRAIVDLMETKKVTYDGTN